MPRTSKSRQSKGTTTKRVSKHKICIVGVVDENDNMFLEKAGNGAITSNMVKNSLTPIMKHVTKLTTECKS